MADATCATCPAWKRNEPDSCERNRERSGQCRMAHPSVVGGANWATTREYDWCMEHPERKGGDDG